MLVKPIFINNITVVLQAVAPAIPAEHADLRSDEYKCEYAYESLYTSKN